MSNKVRVGFIGLGRAASLNQFYYQDADDAELVAICDKNKKRLNKMGDEWGISAENRYEDINSLLKRDDIDAVEVLTPHSLHKEHVILACEAGKHVSVQKVPCMTLSEFDAMQNAARKAGVKLKIFENFQFHPPYMKALELINTGELGKAMAVNVRMWNSIKPLSDWGVELRSVLWRITERENYKLPYLFDDGYHKHNIVHLFLDKDIEYVQAWNKHFRLYKLVRIDIPAVVSYKCKGNEYGTWNISVSNNLPIHSNYYGCDESVEIQCEKGIIWANGCTGNMFMGCDCGGPGTPGVYWIDAKGAWHSDCSMESDWKYSFIECTRDFIESIIQDRAPYRSGNDARHVLQVNLAMVASLRSGFRDYKISSIKDGLPSNLQEFDDEDEIAKMKEEATE